MYLWICHLFSLFCSSLFISSISSILSNIQKRIVYIRCSNTWCDTRFSFVIWTIWSRIQINEKFRSADRQITANVSGAWEWKAKNRSVSRNYCFIDRRRTFNTALHCIFWHIESHWCMHKQLSPIAWSKCWRQSKTNAPLFIKTLICLFFVAFAFLWFIDTK